MHGLQPWQNAQFGSKTKILKKKNYSTSIFQLVCAKKTVQKTIKIRKMISFQKSEKLVTMHAL